MSRCSIMIEVQVSQNDTYMLRFVVDMDGNWPYACGIGVSILVVVVTILGRLRRRIRDASSSCESSSCCKQQKVGNLSGLEVLQVLQQTKIFPIISGPIWKLYSFCYDTRIWHSQLTVDGLSQSIQVYGCYSKVKGSSQVVLNTLKDIHKQMEWQPGLHQVKQITRARERSASKNKNSPSLPVQNDYVSLETETENFWLIRFINSVSERLQGEPLIRKIFHVNRYWHREDNGCCWMLEVTDGLGEWTFYLTQPVEEMDQCLLTIVQSSSRTKGTFKTVHPASRLGALQNYLLYRKVQCTPLVTLSLPVLDDKDWLPDEDQSPQQLPPKTVEEVETKTKTEVPVSGKTQTNLLQRFCNLIEEKKEWYEEQKRQRNAKSAVHAASPTPSSPSSMVCSPMESTFTVDEEESDDSDSDTPVVSSRCSQPHDGNSRNEATSKTAANEKPKTERKSILKFLRSSSAPVVTAVAERKTSCDSNEETSVQVRSGLAVNLMKRIQSLDRPGKQVATPNGEETQQEGEDEKMVASLRTTANTVAAEIMAEKLKVSQIDISRSYDDQAKQTGGWIYCGLEKEVVILRKIFEDGTPLQSYLGRGLIAVPPKTVFEALKNPRTRFTYDEMLKKVDILQDLGCGMKVVYLYHEVSQLFRKEARDFCILQSERIEGIKYVISMVSVDWAACVQTEDVTRGKFQASGWIIEPTSRDNKLYSMVTYIVQMDLRTNKTNTGYLIEELAAKQPLSIAYLRQYLLPVGGIQRPTSLDVERKHSPQTTPVSTLAAAAAFANVSQQVSNGQGSPC